MSDAGARVFIEQTLALWQVDAIVEAGPPPVAAVIRTGELTIIVERACGAAIRWTVVSDRRRPCASVVGLLNALRSALGVERGRALRVAAAPPV